MFREYVIVGGGVAGLSASARLVELGIKPLLIDSGDYPAHKVCGEFFSPKGLVLLKKWDIHPIEISSACFFAGNHSLDYHFPSPFGSLSHIQVDPKLLQKSYGIELLKQTTVVDLQPGEQLHRLVLSSGEQITTSNLLLATGRVYNKKILKPKYKGFKAHFKGNVPLKILEMYMFDGGYLGVSPIEEGKYNIAGLVNIESFEKWKTVLGLINHWKAQSPSLANRLLTCSCLFSEWMEVFIPDFGIKNPPNWPHTYFMGDAYGTIPPITGNGLSLGMMSGIMAAEHAINRNYQGFQAASKELWSKPVFWGKTLHALTMHPVLAKQTIRWGKSFPSLFNAFYNLTR